MLTFKGCRFCSLLMNRFIRHKDWRNNYLNAHDIWPAAGQISYRLYGRSNFVTGQTRPVMTVLRCLADHDRSNIRPCDDRIVDRSPPWTALARYQLIPSHCGDTTINLRDGGSRAIDDLNRSKYDITDLPVGQLAPQA